MAWIAPKVTTSFDAAVEMVGRVLPGWCWRSGDETRDGLAIWLGTAKEATPALAICAALLTALLAQAEAPSTSAGGKTDA